jgi:hypothetical protein
LLVAAFVVLGVGYSIATPIFEASDEKSHYPVVKHIADGQGLPVQDPANPGPWLQEGSQPPLYYALAAAATFWIDTSDLAELRKPNPHARIGDARGVGNRNAVSHTDREAFPWQGTTLAVHVVRLLSVLFGAVTVSLTYRLALATWPGRTAVAALAAALVAFNPMFLFVSASVNNDTLVNLLSAWLLLLTVGVVRGRGNLRQWVGLGLGLGLGALTKLSVLALAPPVGLVVLADARRKAEGRRQKAEGRKQGTVDCLLPAAYCLLTSGVVVFGLALVISGWWFWRNWTLYGEPTGIVTMMAVIGGWRDPSLNLTGLIGELPGFWLSFWGVFGLFNVVLPPVVYAAYAVLTLAGLVGIMVKGYRLKVEGCQPSTLWAEPQGEAFNLQPSHLLVLAIFLNLAAAVRWTMLTMGSQGRFLFPTLPAIAVFLAMGLANLVPVRRQAGWVTALTAGLAGLALAVPVGVIAPAYARPPAIASEQVPASARRLDVRFEDRLGLRAAQASGEVLPGNSLMVTLYWEPLSRLTRDYSVTVKVYGRDGRLIGQDDSFPGQGNYPTRAWKLGQVVVDRHLVPVAADAATPAQAVIEVGTYRTSSQDPLTAFDEQGNPLDRVIVGRARLASPAKQPVSPAVPVNYTVGDFATLVGYELEATNDERRTTNDEHSPVILHPSSILRVTLYWQSRAQVPTDYTVFVHFDGPDGLTRAQADGQPDGGNYPTGVWAPGEVVRDTHRLSVPPDAPLGRYTLRVGLYDLTTGRRVPARDATGQSLPNDAVELATVEVRP